MLMFKGYYKTRFEGIHNILNTLFNDYYKLKEANKVGAKEAFEKFACTLHTHMLWEERILFPILERKLGANYIETLKDIKDEHIQLLNYLKELYGVVLEEKESTELEEDKLMKALLKHETKEEQILHPEIVKHFSKAELENSLQSMHDVSSDIFSNSTYRKRMVDH